MHTTNNNDPAGPRWFALVNDAIVITPSRKLSASLLRTLGSIPDAEKLFRDYSSPRDELCRGDDEIDLADGNVFYSGESARPGKGGSRGIAKLAVVVDDRFEILTISEFSAETLREMFGLDDDAAVIRDYESPNDQPVEDDQLLRFEEGVYFISKKLPLEITIIVNGRPKVVHKRKLSYEEVVSLAFPNPDYTRIAYTVTYDRGPRKNPEGSLVKGQTLRIKKGMVLNVSATDQS